MSEIENQNEEKTFKDYGQVLFWNEIIKETKVFLKDNIKRYFPFILFSLLFFLASIATLLPIHFFTNRIEVYLISLIFSLLILVLVFALYYLYRRFIQGTHSENLVRGSLALIVIWGISELIKLI